MAVMTDLRLSLWSAIDAWPPLAGKFKRTWRFDNSHALDQFPPAPTPGECPALAIFPAQGETAWSLTTHHQVTYTLGVMLWTHDWTLARGEALFEEVLKAWYQAKSGTTPIVDRRLAIGALAIQPVQPERKGGIITKWSWSVSLPAFWQPQLS